MRIKPLLGSVVGPINESHWGQVLLLPHAYGLVEVENQEGKAQAIGVRLLSSFSSLLESKLTSLKQIEEAVEKLPLDSIQTLLVLMPVGRVVYLVLRGEGKVLLRRGRELAVLMQKQGGLSGEVQEGDTLLLASKGFTDALSPYELQQALSFQPQEAAEKLTLILHEHQDGTGSVALVFGVRLDTSAQETVAAPVIQSRPKETIARFPRRVRRIASGLRRVLTRRPTRAHLHHAVDVFRAQPKRVQLIISIVLVSVFLVSVGLGIMKQTTNAKKRQIQESLSQAQHLFDEGVALMSLNPIKGRQRLTEAQGVLEPLTKSVSQRTPEGRAVAVMYQQAKESLTLAMQIYKQTPQVYYDVGLVKKGGRVSDVALDGKDLAIVDQATRTVYHAALQSKNVSVIAGGDAYTGLAHGAIHGDEVYVFTPEGIHFVRVTDTKTTKHVVKKADDWGTIIDLVSYGGNLYLLDSAKSRIWKYVATDKGLQGFSELGEYLNPDTLPNFSRATGMAIDGSVWIGTTDGHILRFTQGKENPFLAKGVEPALSGSLFVYTNDVARHLYVLEPRAKRVVVLDKDGMYLAQYTWEEDVLPSSMVVSEQEKLILLLAQGKLYALSLK